MSPWAASYGDASCTEAILKRTLRLLKNICMKATADAPSAPPQLCPSPSISDKAKQLVDLQRDRIVTMAATDPQRPHDERMLEQANARSIDAASRLLDPSLHSPDASNA